MKKKNEFLKQTYVTQTKGYLDVSSKKELLQKICESFNGKFQLKHTKDEVLHIVDILIPYKNCLLHLTESDTKPLKFEIAFDCLSDFDLVLSWEDSIEKILKKLGKHEFELGNKDFDDHYLIQTKYPELTQELLSKSIQKTLLDYNVYSIKISKDNDKKNLELLSIICRTFDDEKSYEDMIKLHFELIDRLALLKIVKC